MKLFTKFRRHRKPTAAESLARALVTLDRMLRHDRTAYVIVTGVVISDADIEWATAMAQIDHDRIRVGRETRHGDWYDRAYLCTYTLSGT